MLRGEKDHRQNNCSEWQPLGTVLYLSHERGELSKWLFHDNSTINIVLGMGIVCIHDPSHIF